MASRTGLLQKLGPGASTASGIADAAGLSLRYVEEILAVLVCGKIVELAGEETPLKYFLASDRKAVLDGMGLYFEEMPLLAQCAFDQVVAAARDGGGVACSNYGPFGNWMGKLADEKHESSLINKFMPILAGGSVVAQLQEPGACVLDIGCGEGTAPRLMAQSFPSAKVVGVDSSKASVDAAKAKADKHGIANVEFYVGDVAALAEPDGKWTGQIDLVTSFDVIHDLTNPEAALRECRRLLKPDTGIFAMVDIRAGSGLRANLDHQMAPFLYAVSLMHCMPQGLNDGGPGLGMMWGRQKATSMLEAIFRDALPGCVRADPFEAPFRRAPHPRLVHSSVAQPK